MRRIIILFSVLIAALIISWFYPDGDEQVGDSTAQIPTMPDQRVAQINPVEPASSSDLVTPKIIETHDGVRQIELGDGANFNEAMELLGITDLEDRMAEWSKNRGYPFLDQSGTYLLEQPYDQYDDDTLRAFAENEDMWAQQFLAERLEKTRPAEALDWYRKAAINGSISAIDRMTALYRKLNRTRVNGSAVDPVLKEQVNAIRESVGSFDEMSFAWSVAGVMAGSDPSRNNVLSERISRNFDEATLDRACNMASALYDDMSSARGQRDLGDFDRTPPPFLLGTREDLQQSTCGGAPPAPYMDFSQCEEVSVVTNGVGSRLMICNES